MTDEEEFEGWYLSKFDAPDEIKETFGYLQHKLTVKEAWLEKGKRDREKIEKLRAELKEVVQWIDDEGWSGLLGEDTDKYVTEIRQLLEEMK
jgi:hypothetical protein